MSEQIVDPALLPTGDVPVVTRHGAESTDTAQSGDCIRVSGVSIQHTPATKIWYGQVRNKPGYRSLPHHHGEAETGGYVLSGHGRIYYGEGYTRYTDMTEGDWVFVPPYMPHVEANMSITDDLVWLTCRTPENIVVNLDDVDDATLEGVPPRMTTVNEFDSNVADSARFLDAVRLTETDDAPAGHRAFTATTQYVPWPKAYGGDLVAQAVAAACATVEGKTVHSAHSYFLRPAEIGGDVRYEVEILRDGRGYATRHVRGLQGGKVIYTCYASFAAGADGTEVPGAPLVGEVAGTGLAGVPAPEGLPSSAEALAGRDGADADYWSHGRSFEMRHVPDPIYLPGDRDRAPRQAVWIKAFSTLPEEQTVHDIALAYCCDYTILEPSLRALGASWSDDGLRTASLDHAMWFHRPARLDDWVLYSQESVNVGSSRGLNTGRFHDRNGTHLATVCQEGLLAQ